MIPFFISFLTCLSAFFRLRYNLGLEILALRQQMGILKLKQPHPRLRIQDRIFWILLRRLWPAWSNILIIVKPETVVAWHRAGFRLFWRLRSRPKSLGSQSSMPRCELSSGGLCRRVHPGALLGFTVNFSNSASTSLNAQFLATSGACLLPSRQGNSGLLSCAITARSSRPWTSLII